MNKATVPPMFTEASSELSTTHSYRANTFCNLKIILDFGGKMGTTIIVFYSLISVFGVMGNGLVIFITGLRMKKTFTTVFFLNLAIADFIIIATNTVPLIIGYLITFRLSWWLNGGISWKLCMFMSTMKFLNLYSSVFFLMVISIGRYICVRYPMWSRNRQTPRLASWVALGVWILSLALSSAYVHYDIPKRNTTLYVNVSYVSTSLSKVGSFCYDSYSSMYSSFKHYLYSMFISHVILSFILPFIVMISCYGATTLRLRRSQFAQSGKPSKAMIAVTVAFFVCWFPVNMMTFIKPPIPWLNCHMYNVYHALRSLSDFLAYFNSCLNPIIYVFIGRNYRENLRCSLFSALENAFHEEQP